MTLNTYGLKCARPPHIGRVLSYESPINVTEGLAFSGACSIGAFTYINGPGSFADTSIGRFCSIADWVVAGPGQHQTDEFSTHPFRYDPTDATAALGEFPAYRSIIGKTPVTAGQEHSRSRLPNKITIGNDVWIGMRAIIMNGVTVGDGAVIGAGSIVTKDVPPYAVVAGVPARVIRHRFSPAVIARMLELRWWDYDMSHVSNRVDYGRVEAVIEFMTDRIKAGQLPRFTTKRYELKQNGANYVVGPLPPV